MKRIQSECIAKGYKNGNCYYIIQHENENYNVYQIFHELNKDATVQDIKSILPFFKYLPDDEVIVSVPNEHFPALLLLHDVDIYEMNRFRVTLDEEQIIV